MANNVIKVGSANDGLSIQQGPFAIGAAGLGDYGPTSRTNYYASAEIPQGGYAFYHVDDSGNIRANVAHDDNQAMYFLKSYGATGTTLNEMLSWASASGTVIGLDADITTTEIVTANSGSAGTNGTSGSGGGSSQFPKAWVMKTYRGPYVALSNSVPSSTSIVYTAGSTIENGVRIYADPELTIPITNAYYARFEGNSYSWQVTYFDWSGSYVTALDAGINQRFSLYYGNNGGDVCAQIQNIDSAVINNLKLDVGVQVVLPSNFQPYTGFSGQTLYVGLGYAGSPIFVMDGTTMTITSQVPGSTC